MAGAVAAGVALLAWGVRKLMSSSSEETESPGFYKLNFDGCDRHQLNQAGAGCIIRDSNGSLVVAAAYNLSRQNISVAEAEALRKGLQLAKQRKIKNLSIEGDSTEVIDRVLGHIDTKRSESGIYPIIEGIKKEMQGLCFRIKHIPSAHNTVAHELANIGAKDQVQKIWDCASDLPSKVAQQIEKDRNGY
ncbi:hypothetical protein Nepgr_003647 [Nepenthes gracilis]|uniref:RNase H type-1 domain-containing protein n=1 Tax=Nepenthes gracilis TaxID=150966 RepID=A0AAD3RZW1_NEPGR|nr:hypothetical protein Nepgr_003647 [Nepenthes gracilis]